MTRRVILVAVGLITASCGTTGQGLRAGRGEALPWDSRQVEQLSREVETLIADAARQSEDTIIARIGTELEFGEEKVDTSALAGGVNDLRDEVPSLKGFGLQPQDIAGAIRARQLRASTVREWKRRRCAGEGEQGKLVYVRCRACQDDSVLADQLSFIIIKENRNRQHVYDAVMTAARWPNRRMPQLRAIFAATIKELGEPADLFRGGDGWIAKVPGAVPKKLAQPAVTRDRRRRPVLSDSWEQGDVFDFDAVPVPPRAVPQR